MWCVRSWGVFKICVGPLSLSQDRSYPNHPPPTHPHRVERVVVAQPQKKCGPEGWKAQNFALFYCRTFQTFPPLKTPAAVSVFWTRCAAAPQTMCHRITERLRYLWMLIMLRSCAVLMKKCCCGSGHGCPHKTRHGGTQTHYAHRRTHH